MTSIGNFAFHPSQEVNASDPEEVPETERFPARWEPASPACEIKQTANQSHTMASERTRATTGLPKIAFVRWLASHRGRSPSDFEPIIKEAEFAFRCRAALAPTCSDLGGVRSMERQLGNLELGLCCGWRVLEQAEARSLSDWLDAVLLHHPWRDALDWRQTEAREALLDYYRAEGPVDRQPGWAQQMIGAAGLGDVLNHALAFKTWRDVQGVVLSAWLGGTLIVDEQGYLIPDWKVAFVKTIVSRIESLR